LQRDYRFPCKLSLLVCTLMDIPIRFMPCINLKYHTLALWPIHRNVATLLIQAHAAWFLCSDAKNLELVTTAVLSASLLCYLRYGRHLSRFETTELIKVNCSKGNYASMITFLATQSPVTGEKTRKQATPAHLVGAFVKLDLQSGKSFSDRLEPELAALVQTCNVRSCMFSSERDLARRVIWSERV